MQRFALYLQDKHQLSDCIRYAKYAEENGFEAVWQAESPTSSSHSVIRVSDQAATSACSKTSLRLGFVVPEPIEDPRIRVRQAELRRIPPSLVEGRSKPRNEDWIDFLRTTALVNRGISDRRVSALIGNAR